MAVLLITWAIGLRSANLKALANVLMIVAGVVIAPYGEAGFDLTGFTYQAAGIAFEATRISLIQKLLSSPEYKMDAIVSLYYFAPMSTAFNFLAFLIFEAGKLQLENILRVGPFVLSLNAVSAFALNVAVVLLVRQASGENGLN